MFDALTAQKRADSLREGQGVKGSPSYGAEESPTQKVNVMLWEMICLLVWPNNWTTPQPN